jgi:hypothetical protein
VRTLVPSRLVQHHYHHHRRHHHEEVEDQTDRFAQQQAVWVVEADRGTKWRMAEVHQKMR